VSEQYIDTIMHVATIKEQVLLNFVTCLFVSINMYNVQNVQTFPQWKFKRINRIETMLLNR